MTVLATYATFRVWFAAPGASLAADGFPVFPGPLLADGSVSNTGASKLRAAGFSTSWTVTTAGAHAWSPASVGPTGPLIAAAVPSGDALFPMTVTIDGGASDGGTDSYAWYLSQNVDPVRLPSIDYPTSIQPGSRPQLFTMQHPGDRLHSGTVVIDVASSEVLKLFPSSGGLAPTDAGSLLTLCMGSVLYVTRLSDRAYQAASLVNLAPPPGV